MKIINTKFKERENEIMLNHTQKVFYFYGS